jgi:hypothetical protein
MNTSAFKALTAFTLVTLLAAAPVFATPKRQKVKGKVAGTIVFTPPTVAAGIHTIKVECIGALSSLGRTRVVWEGSAALDAALAGTPLPSAGWTLTTANGSTLKGAIEWQIQPESVLGSLYVLRGPCQLTTGTGRYLGATGSGVARGTLNVLTGECAFEFDGEVRPVK